MMNHAIDMMRRRRWPLLVAGSALTAAYVLWTIALPRLMEAGVHWRAVQGRDTVVRRAATWREDLQQIQRQRRRLLARYAPHHTSAQPPGGWASTALDGLRSAADETGVTLHAIRPGAKTIEQTYAVRRMTARVTGTFPQVVRFVRAIEMGSPFINVAQLSCRALNEPSGPETDRAGAAAGARHGAFVVESEITGLAITPRFGWMRALSTGS